MCDCIDKVNEQFARTPALANTVLDCALAFPPDGGEPVHHLMIATRKRDPKNRKKAKTIFPSFCPFCGERVSTINKEEVTLARWTPFTPSSSPTDCTT